MFDVLSFGLLVICVGEDISDNSSKGNSSLSLAIGNEGKWYK